jgi:hypothetical protein
MLSLEFINFVREGRGDIQILFNFMRRKTKPALADCRCSNSLSLSLALALCWRKSRILCLEEIGFFFFFLRIPTRKIQWCKICTSLRPIFPVKRLENRVFRACRISQLKWVGIPPVKKKNPILFSVWCFQFKGNWNFLLRLKKFFHFYLYHT